MSAQFSVRGGELKRRFPFFNRLAWLWQAPEEYVQEEIAQKREVLAQIVARAGTTVDADEVRKFTEEYEAYLAKLEPALMMRFIRDHNSCCRLELTVVNEGTAPAHEVSVTMTFPEGSSVITMDHPDSNVKIQVNLPDEPALPEWAKLPAPAWMQNILSPMQLSSMTSLMQSMEMVKSSLATHQFHPPGYYANTYYFENFPFNNSVINERTKRIGHHRRIIIDPVLVYLPANVSAGFTITYSLLFDEMPDPIIGELKVQWE